MSSPVPGFKEYQRTTPPVIDEETEAMASFDRDIGSLQEAVRNLQEAVSSLSQSVAALNVENTKLQLLIAEGKGGWKALTVVGGFAAAIGGIVAKFGPMLFALPR